MDCLRLHFSLHSKLNPFTSRLIGEQLLQQNHLWPGERTVLEDNATAVLMHWANGITEVHAPQLAGWLTEPAIG